MKKVELVVRNSENDTLNSIIEDAFKLIDGDVLQNVYVQIDGVFSPATAEIEVWHEGKIAFIIYANTREIAVEGGFGFRYAISDEVLASILQFCLMWVMAE